MMKRKNFFLYEYQIRGLENLSWTDGKSIVEHVRLAIDGYLRKNKAMTFTTTSISPSKKGGKND